jgi:hypothetical protein
MAARQTSETRLPIRRRRLVALAVGAVAVGPLAVGANAPAVAGGPAACTSGTTTAYETAVEPFEIRTAEQLILLSESESDWDKTFLQTADIDLEGCLWSPIGFRDYDPDVDRLVGTDFTGEFDGGGNVIRGFRIVVSTSGSGFFGWAEDATIENVRLIGTDEPSATVDRRIDFGLLVGRMAGTTVRNSHAEGSIESDFDRVGGLIGSASEGSSIEGSSAAVDIVPTGAFNTSRIGGLVGELQGTGSVIADSSASGNVTATAEQVGGLVGQTLGGTLVIRSFATGDVTGHDEVGGLIGKTGSDIFYSFATGAVTGGVNESRSDLEGVGGLVGMYVTSTSTIDSYARGDVTIGQEDQRIGGLFGQLQYIQTPLERTYSSGRVRLATGVTSSEVGGFAGRGGQEDGVFDGVVTDLDEYTGMIANFWDSTTAGLTGAIAGLSIGGVSPDSLVGTVEGRSTADMRSFATFEDAGWAIVEGWAEFVEPEGGDSGTVWGICPKVNDGYPYLLWQFTSDPCVVPVVTDGSTSSLALSCEGLVAVGAEIVCSISGGDPGIGILWQAAYNPTFAGAGVTLDTGGSGTFRFRVPAAALGRQLTVELVEWLAPVSLGVVGGPVPSNVPAGEGPVVPAGLIVLGLLAAVGAAVAVRRQVVAG